MSFVKITDPKRRDEIVQEYIRMKKSIQKQSFDKLLEDKNIYTQGEKLFKPIIDAQKDEGDKISKELQKVTSSIDQLTILPPGAEGGPLPIEGATPGGDSKAILQELKGMNLGPVAYEALSTPFVEKGSELYDNVTGIRKSGNKFFLGNKELKFDGDNILIDGDEYEGTPGLWQLLMAKKPLDGSYNQDDLDVYSDIMKRTKALRQEKNPERPKTNGGFKWENLLRPIWFEEKDRLKKEKKEERAREKQARTSTPKKKKGKGVEFLPSDPAQLLEQLKLSFASNQAGNTGERNRIVSILETLLGMGIIKREEYKNISLSIK